jgi:hypothetical protein
MDDEDLEALRAVYGPGGSDPGQADAEAKVFDPIQFTPLPSVRFAFWADRFGISSEHQVY